MSKTLNPNPVNHPLQLDFVQAGTVHTIRQRWVHVKTIPYTILAQALEGTYEVKCMDRYSAIPTNGIFLIPANTPVEITHNLGPRGIMRAQWIHLRYSYYGVLDFLSIYNLPLSVPEQACRKIGKEIGALLKVGNGTQEDPVSLIAAHESAIRILRVICEVSARNKESGQMIARRQRLMPVLNYMRDHMADPLSVQNLAVAAFISPAHFHAVFKAAFDISPMQYLRNIRLDAASRMLAATDDAIGSIAEATGFADAFHFSHVFSKRFGLSPRAYRQQAVEWLSHST